MFRYCGRNIFYNLNMKSHFSSRPKSLGFNHASYLPPPPLFPLTSNIGRLEGAGCGLVPHLRSEKTLVMQFPLKGRLLLQRSSGNISKWLLFLSPCSKHRREFFSHLQGKNLVRLLEVKSMNMSGVSLTLSLEEYLTLKLVHTQSPEIHQNYHVSVPTRLWLQCLLPQIN